MSLFALRSPTKVFSYQLKSARFYAARGARARKPQTTEVGENSIATLIDQGLGIGKRRAKGVRPFDVNRINVINPKLCDDVIERLAPSLEEYKGCDLIDVNPGACVWSSALHDFLQPRSHLLLEPDTAAYEQFYEPLLKKRGSKYKLIPESGILWSTWKSIHEHLPAQEILSRGDPRQHLPNRTLLFTANLGRRPQNYVRVQLAHLFLYQLMSACRNRTIFQAYGSIRMLIWVEGTERASLLPRVITGRGKFSAEAELTFESIVEVASSAEESTNKRRDPSLELDSAMQVVHRMESAGIKTPTGRAGRNELEAKEKLKGISSDENSTESAKRSRISTRYVKELEELEARFAAGGFTKWANLDPNVKKSDNVVTPDFERMRKLRYRWMTDMRRSEGYDEKASQYLHIRDMEQAIQDLPVDEAEERKAEINKLLAELEESLGALAFGVRDQFWHRLHDRVACQSDPPLLYWDRRPYEPLKVEPEEFHPQAPMALFDIQPKAIDPIYRSMANYDEFGYILTTLWSAPSQSVLAGLESLAHGALDWILPRCPSLTDVAKGGSTNLEYLPTRRLTQENYKEIMAAWMDWPFRPTFEQILARQGASTSSASLPEEDTLWGGGNGLLN